MGNRCQAGFKPRPGFISHLCFALMIASTAFRCSGDDEPLKFTGLGEHTRAITTSSSQAQRLFNQGLAFLYSFNHDEAIRSFREARQHDPNAAMIDWAIALANGPHINYPLVDATHAAAAWEALAQAKQTKATATAVEQALIDALSERYANPQPEDRRPLDLAYAEAMRKVWQRFPDDPDVGSLFAEALMDLWPWDLWTAEGKMNADTAEVLQTIERVFAINPQHPLALHLYIHALEASPHPERAALAAAALRNLQPGLGHMVHMPSHIDVRLGNWANAIEANEKAIQVDSVYRGKSPEQDFFRFYMAHNHHMLAYAATMRGQNQLATTAIQQMLADIPDAWREKNAIMIDGMYTMPYELHIRFGRWDELLAEPAPAASLPITTAFRRYARGVAFAAKQQVPDARREQQQFRQLTEAIPQEAMFVMNPAHNVLAIADAMLDGEILYREGKLDEAITALTEGVTREEQLRYIEPPDWFVPVRHALGATLMDAKRYKEAETVYRADLQRHPNNGWSLHGLSQSLLAQGKTTEAKEVRQQFETAWQHADIELTSSCFCLP